MNYYLLIICSLRSSNLIITSKTSKSVFFADKERLDYVEDYQDLYTRSETLDVELFSIPSEGLFMAAANRYQNQNQNPSTSGLKKLKVFNLHGNSFVWSYRDSRPGSGIYKWINGSFQLYQNASTQEAQAWKYFTIDDKVGVT